MRPSWILGLSLLASGCKSNDEPADPPADDGPQAKAPTAEEEPEASAPEPPPLPEPELLEPLGEPETKGGDEPKIAVTLPPSPDFPSVDAPARYPDGAWSIRGLREDLDENLREGEAGTEVVVRGWVMEIYVPPECPEGEVCPPGKQPHIWITDTEEERGLARAMLVVNYAFRIPEWEAERWEGQPVPVFEKGRRYTVRGRFKQFSDTGFAHGEGLLEFVAYRPLDPDTGAELTDYVYPPGAPWHPIEIARQEEENRKLAERAAAGRGR